MTYHELIFKYETEMQSNVFSKDDVLIKAEAGILTSEHFLKQLRKLVVANGFRNDDDEIEFFKILKPQIFSNLIYYIKLFNVESKRPRSRVKSQIKFLDNQIRIAEVFFKDNLEFYNYYRRGLTSLDHKYFLRGNTDLRLSVEAYNFFMDEKFSTFQDTTVAVIKAHDKLIFYLTQEIKKLQTPNRQTTESFESNHSDLYWTASKTELIELIYALHHSGCINRGSSDIKGLAINFEFLFNIDLGNYYHTFIEIRARKSSKTKFLDSLTESLMNRFNELDQ